MGDRGPEQKPGRGGERLFVTEGILLRQMLMDPVLKDVSAILFDDLRTPPFWRFNFSSSFRAAGKAEARPQIGRHVCHSRGYGFAWEYMTPCEVLQSEGRTFPVNIVYKNVEGEPLWEAAADAVEHHFSQMESGHALVFMPGAYEIGRTIQAIRASREPLPAGGKRLRKLALISTATEQPIDRVCAYRNKA